jgi:predicted subunit of tRNA(5-methylaminomethyl-2-thiouridylate) methyltransferase
MLSDASVLFSGGSDSTLAAVRMLERHQRVHLLTFEQGLVLFIERSRAHASLLRSRFGESRVTHHVINITELFHRVFVGDLRHDLTTYGPALCVQVCHGCRIAMHAHAILFNLLHGVRYLADGNIRKQESEPFQLRSMMAFNQKYYEQFGVVYCSPIYEEEHSDRVLEQMGLSVRSNLKRQFILFDTQATCAVGVPADVYGRLFYRGLMKERHRMDSERYRMEKEPLFRQFLDDECRRRGLQLPDLVARLRATDPGSDP